MASMQPDEVCQLLGVSTAHSADTSFFLDISTLLESATVGFWVWNIQTGDTLFNERWAEIIGYTLDELRPLSIQTWENFCHPDDLKESDRSLKDYWDDKTENYNCESRMLHKNGSWVWVHDSGHTIKWDSDGKPLLMMGTHYDITQHKLKEQGLIVANQALEKLARTDPLTNLFNRRELDNRIHDLKILSNRSAIPITLAIIDIDNFKMVNDTKGHQHGDHVLKLFSEISQSVLTRESDLIARVGGDEFVIVLPHTEMDEAVKQIEKIIKKFKAAYSTKLKPSETFQVTCSVGMSSTKSNAIDNLLAIADKNLYVAKNAGRDRIITNNGA